MTRDRLPDRRYGVTVKVEWGQLGGPDHAALVTYGFDGEPGRGGRIKEAFVASFKAVSPLIALVNDACILYSRALQHGDTLEELAATMVENRPEGSETGPPASMVGAVARAAVEVQRVCDGGEPLISGEPRSSWEDKLRSAVVEAVREAWIGEERGR